MMPIIGIEVPGEEVQSRLITGGLDLFSVKGPTTVDRLIWEG